MHAFTLGALAERIGASVQGDETFEVHRLAALDAAESDAISFLSNPRYASQLSETRAGAVIITPQHADDCPTHALICDNPYLAYAKLSVLFDPQPQRAPQIHATAQIASTATVASSAYVGAHVVVGEDAVIAAGAVVEANCSIGDRCVIGANTRVYPNVVLYHDVRLGADVIVHSGVVIGADGFGFAPHAAGWQKIAQIGGVVIGDRVEIGANTTIDRGAINDTVIGSDVILDNQIQIAHNVHIGDKTAIAACVGIAGSTQIGARCLIGGGAKIAGHLTICDNTQISATAVVINSIHEPGVYSSGVTADKHRSWLKNAARFRKLTELFKRVETLEKKLEQ